MVNLIGRAIPLWNRMFPKATGPRGLRYEFPLNTNTTYAQIFQLTEIGLDMINGVFIDNSLNSAGFTLTNPVTGQIIFVPAYSQADFALNTAQSTDNVAFIGASTGGVVVPCMFKNTEPSGNTVWSTIAAGQIIGSVTVQGSVTSLPYVASGTDGLGSIALGGTAQLLYAANPSRKGLFIANPASMAGQNIGVAPESLFVKYGVAPVIGGANVIEISPGGYFNPLGFVDNRDVYILATTTGHAFDSQQYQ